MTREQNLARLLSPMPYRGQHRASVDANLWELRRRIYSSSSFSPEIELVNSLRLLRASLGVVDASHKAKKWGNE